MQFGVAIPGSAKRRTLDASLLRRRFLRFLTFGFAFLLLGISSTAGQDTLPTEPISSTDDGRDLLDDFDGVRTSMRIIEGRSLARIRRHQRSDHSPYRGRRSEFISVIGARGGERILAAQEIKPVAAISELEFALWLRGNRNGFQLMARVRLPRSLNDAGEPIAIYVLGDRYSSTKNWQRLTVSGFEDQISSQVRAMRVDAGSYVDATEAYVDQVAINIYGGAENNVLSIDDLTAFAAVPVPVYEKKKKRTIHLANYQSPLAISLPTRKASENPNWIPRVAKHRGETFADLKRFGFNTIWLPNSATREQRATAAKLQIELVCPPPKQLDESGSFANVAAWFIPNPNTPYSPEQIAAIRGSMSQPILSASAKVADIHLTSPTSPASPTASPRWIDTSDAVRWLAVREELRAGVFAGQSGFVFDAEPFAQLDTSYAKAVAQLFNLELSILRPWILQHETNEPIRPTTPHADFEVHGMASRHAGLIWVSTKPVSALQTGNRPANEIFVDLPDAQYRDLYHIEPGSLEPARDRRIPGGVRVTLNHDKPDGLLLMSSHPQILQAHKQHLQSIEKQYNKLLVDVIRHEMLQLDRQLATTISDPTLVGHLRQELHALRGRITPVLESREQLVTYRQLDHVLGQLERVHQLTSNRF